MSYFVYARLSSEVERQSRAWLITWKWHAASLTTNSDGMFVFERNCRIWSLMLTRFWLKTGYGIDVFFINLGYAWIIFPFVANQNRLIDLLNIFIWSFLLKHNKTSTAIQTYIPIGIFMHNCYKKNQAINDCVRLNHTSQVGNSRLGYGMNFIIK